MKQGQMFFISRSLDNKILNFQIFKCHDLIKCLGKKDETHFTEQLGK